MTAEPERCQEPFRLLPDGQIQRPVAPVLERFDAAVPSVSMSVEISGTLTASGFELLSRVYHGEFNA